MTQLSLFAKPAPPEEPRKVNLRLIRSAVVPTLQTLRQAQRLPWYEFELADWEERFPRLCAYLPEEEGKAALEEFRREVERLKAQPRIY